MSLSINTIKYKLLAVVLSVALVACFVLHPLQARAASTDLDYIETTDDIETIKADLVALPAAALTIILGIIGFIAITYVVARNVSVPIEYSAGATFWDKCYELGQYCFDNATQALAPVFRSVQTFVSDNSDLGTWGALSAFTALNLTKFFTAFSVWLSSTFVGADVTTTAAGLIETAQYTELSWSDYGPLGVYEQFGEYPYYEAIAANLVAYTSGAYVGVINPAHIFGYYYLDYLYGVGYQCKYRFFEFLPAAAGYTMIISGDSTVRAGFYTLNGNTLARVSSINGLARCLEYRYSVRSGRFGASNPPTYVDVVPDLAANNNISIINDLASITLSGYDGRGDSSDYYNLPSLRDPVNKVLSLAILAGIHVAYYTGALPMPTDGIAVDSDDLNWVTELPTAPEVIDTAPRDTILNPGESVDIDLGHIADTLGGISEQVDAIRDGLENGSTLELLKLLLSLTNADTLTQTAVATSTNPTIDPTPTYPIPGLDNVWKYVTYMFSTLGGWITFVGNCLQAVTVGEGGLSWIFYGAFIFIICGGFIGKLLL